ncbi:MAG TPA: M14 family metallopeptidase [Candidatus Eisenbacteria bacterium]|jgi:murein tripeptide amidase MpaA
MLAAALLATALAAPQIAATTAAGPDTTIPLFWRTRAERTDYHATPDYDETMRYCRQIEGGSRWVKVESYGTSGQGRDLPLVILSRERAFTPEQAIATGKPIVLVQNGIHSGEIEGKDACLALMRDIAVLRRRAELLDHCILLVLPIFSVDAHERRGRYNRINQNGPDEMGWRSTPIGLNLNRDYLKAETPEMRALLSRVYTRWWPHLLVDDHTTDGADFRHDVTYGFNHGAGTPPAVTRWLTEAFEGRVVPRIDALGHLTAPYITFRRGSDPMSGIDFGNSTPRFSTGYAPLQCRPAILVETHMLKPYENRVRATYDLLLALLEEINAHPEALLGAVADAEAAAVARGRAADPARREVVLASRTTDQSVPFAFKGVATRRDSSEITASVLPRYGTDPVDQTIPLYRETEATLTVRQPVGYLIPREWTICRDRLEIHGVRFRRFAKAWSDSVEVQRVVAWSDSGPRFEGHDPIEVRKVALERRLRSYRPGDLWVPLEQRSAMVAVHLFEAQAPDGLMYWNAFDTVFQQKEYAEDYVMEPIAREMLKKDPALAREFQAKLSSDSAFAKSPDQRVNFFYLRSPWADPEQNVHPVARALRAPPESVLEPAR